MNTLFGEQKVVHRRRNGQFATKDVAYADRIKEENKLLRLERDKYQRAWMSLVNENKRLREKIAEIKTLLM